MSFTNSDIFQLCRFLVNKENLSGYLNIDDFNRLLKMSSVLLLKEKLGMSNDYQLLLPVARKQKGISLISDDEIKQFKSIATLSFSSGIAPLPATYFKYDTLRVDSALEPVEVLNSTELSKRLGDAIDAPDADFPAAEIINSSVYIYPTTITSATLVYYRYTNIPILDFYVDVDGEVIPLEAGVTYTLQAGETGSAGQTSGDVVSTTVEHEWKDDNAIELAYIITKNLGINLGRTDVFQVADKIQKEGV